MIEQICTLLSDAQASAMHLTIRPDGQGNVSISFVTQGCELALEDEEKKNPSAAKLRAALASPLTLSGSIGEMDVAAITELAQFAEAYVPAQRAFHAKATNLHAVFNQLRAATPEQAKPATETASEPPASATTPVDDEDSL